MTAPIQPTGLQDGTMGGAKSTPLSPVQKMRANLQWLRERGASMQEQNAEIDRWRPKIEAYNRGEQAQAGSFGNLAAQALTLNAGDEIAGVGDAIGALIPGGQSPAQAYRSTRDAVAGTNAALRETQPGKSLAVELGTGVASGLGAGFAAGRAGVTALPFLGRLGKTLQQANVPLEAARRTVQATTGVGRVGQNLAIGGGVGAAAGAAGAEPGERGRGAAIGAATGTAVAGGLQAGGALVGQAAKRLGFGPRAPDTRMGTVQSAIGAETADIAAANRIAERVGASGRPVEDILTMNNPNITSGSMLADIDVGGQQAARLAGTAKRLGTSAAERVEETMGARARDRGVRMGSELTRISGVGAFNPERMVDDLIDEARTKAKPLYEQVRQFPAVNDARIAEAVELIPEDRVRSLWKGVQDIARLEGRKLRPLLDQDGKLAFDLEPSEMDLFKRALDEVIYSGGRQAKMGQPGGLTNTETALLNRARRLIVSAADDATGGPDGVYAQARRTFAGPIAIREALEAGGDLTKMTRAEIESAVEGLSPAQRAAFGQGGVQAIREGLEKTTEGQTGVARRLTSPERKAQYEAALNDPTKAESFRRMVSGEQARERTEGMVMRGSPTAERLADDELATLPINPSQGLMSSAIDAVRRPLERAVIRGTTAPEMDAVARVLTEDIGDPNARAKVLRFIQEGKRARADMAAKAALRRAGLIPAATSVTQERQP